MKLFFSSLGLAALAAGCPPSPAQPPVDAADAFPPPTPAEVEAACATVDKFACPEARTCVASLTRLATIRSIDVQCLIHADTTAALRACSGGVVPCAR